MSPNQRALQQFTSKFELLVELDLELRDLVHKLQSELLHVADSRWDESKMSRQFLMTRPDELAVEEEEEHRHERILL